MRLTNADLIAAQLEKTATPEDMILVSPWWPGVSFQRYYHGATPWSTLPDLGELRVQRFDALKKKMAENAPIQPILEKIARTLSSGHRVYVVSALGSVVAPLVLQQPQFNVTPIPKGPASEGVYVEVWSPGENRFQRTSQRLPVSEGVYLEAWSRQIAFLLRTRTLQRNQVPVPTPNTVPWYENLTLLCFEGWH